MNLPTSKLSSCCSVVLGRALLNTTLHLILGRCERPTPKRSLQGSRARNRSSIPTSRRRYVRADVFLVCAGMIHLIISRSCCLLGGIPSKPASSDVGYIFGFGYIYIYNIPGTMYIDVRACRPCTAASHRTRSQHLDGSGGALLDALEVFSFVHFCCFCCCCC